MNYEIVALCILPLLLAAIIVIIWLRVRYGAACEDRDSLQAKQRQIDREYTIVKNSVFSKMVDEKNALEGAKKEWFDKYDALSGRHSEVLRQCDAYRDELNATYKREWEAECKRIESEPILIGHGVESAGFGAGVLQGSEEGDPDIYVIRDYHGTAMRAHKSLVVRAKPRQKILHGLGMKDGAGCPSPNPRYA